ncbi:hypothetical protein Tco_0377823 [Tanacetum coccineum]
MNPVTAQQVALDNALVVPEKRLKIEKCNARIEFSKPQREDTYQVTLDALKLSPCYPAFLIIAEVPKIICTGPGEHLMLSLIGASLGSLQVLIGSGLQELKSCGECSTRRMLTMLLYFRDDSLLGTLKFVSKTQDYQMYGALIFEEMINQDISKAYKTYLDFATGKATPKKARKFRKVASPSKKLSPVLEEEPAKKPNESMLKKKALAKVDRGKGMDLLSDVAVLDESQDKTTSTNEGTGTIPWVPDVPKYQSESENESWRNSEDDDRNDDDSDDVTNDDDDSLVTEKCR